MNNTKSNKKSKTCKSDEMRKLWSEGLSISQISKQTNSHYSFVYETIKKFARKSNTSFSTNQPEKLKKSDEFRKLYDDGCTIGQIAKQTNSNYSYVWTVIDKYRNA